MFQAYRYVRTVYISIVLSVSVDFSQLSLDLTGTMTHVLLFEIGPHCSDELTFFVSLDRDIYARVMYGGLYSDEFVMPMSEAESRGLARRYYA